MTEEDDGLSAGSDIEAVDASEPQDDVSEQFELGTWCPRGEPRRRLRFAAAGFDAAGVIEKSPIGPRVRPSSLRAARREISPGAALRGRGVAGLASKGCGRRRWRAGAGGGEREKGEGRGSSRGGRRGPGMPAGVRRGAGVEAVSGIRRELGFGGGRELTRARTRRARRVRSTVRPPRRRARPLPPAS